MKPPLEWFFTLFWEISLFKASKGGSKPPPKRKLLFLNILLVIDRQERSAESISTYLIVRGSPKAAKMLGGPRDIPAKSF